MGEGRRTTNRPRLRALYYTETTGFGGAEIALANLLEQASRYDLDLALATPPYPTLEPLWQRALALGVPVLQQRPVARDRHWLGPLDFLRLLWAVRPDVLHVHLTWPLEARHAILLAGLSRRCAATPRALLVHHHLRAPIRWNARQIQFQRTLGQLVDGYVAVSRSLAAMLIDDFQVPADRVHVIPNGVDLRRVPPAGERAALRARLQLRPRDLVVVCTARLTPQKGIDVLVDAMRRVRSELPNVALLVAGDGPERARLVRQARNLGVAERVTFLGWRHDVMDLISAADLCVLPSRFEGLPLTVLEAMAAGRPVVATAVDGTKDIITDGVDGRLVPADDAAELARAIVAVLDTPGAAQRLGLNAAATVRARFDIRAVAAGTIALYHRLLRRPAAEIARVETTLPRLPAAMLGDGAAGRRSSLLNPESRVS